jgi:hypothetical protein
MYYSHQGNYQVDNLIMEYVNKPLECVTPDRRAFIERRWNDIDFRMIPYLDRQRLSCLELSTHKVMSRVDRKFVKCMWKALSTLCDILLRHIWARGFLKVQVPQKKTWVIF